MCPCARGGWWQPAALELLPACGGRWSFLWAQHWWGHTWRAASSSGLLSMAKSQIYWRASGEGPLRWSRIRNIFQCEESLRGLGLNLEKRRLGGISSNPWREWADTHPGSLLLCLWQDQVQWTQIGTYSDLQAKLVLTQKCWPLKSYRTNYKSTNKLILVNKHNLHAGDLVSSQMHSTTDNSHINITVNAHLSSGLQEK